MKIQVVFLLLAAGLEAVVAVDKYFEIGGKLSLKPESVPKEGITSINWKHKGDFVAEWIKDSVPLSYLGDFKGRTDLDTITGELTIRSTTKADEGIFSVEINSKVQTVEYSARGITHLRDKKVEVVERPLTCDTTSIQCTLSCLGHDIDVGPVQYFWQQDEGPWDESEKDRIINNNEETRLIKTFSCKIQNPISDKDSKPQKNPFNKKSEEQDNSGPVGGIVFLVFLILGGIALALYAYKYPQKVSPCLRCVAGHPDQHPHTEESPGDGENGASERTQADTETSKQTPPEPVEINEMMPLNAPETVTSNGTLTPQHDESNVTVYENAEAEACQTPSELDESSEKTPSETFNETPDKS